MDVLRTVGRQMQSKDRARRQAADNHAVAALAKLVQRRLDGPVPVLPARLLQLLFGAAVVRKLRNVHRVAGARHSKRDITHFDRSTTQTVDQQDPGAPPLEFIAPIYAHCTFSLLFRTTH